MTEAEVEIELMNLWHSDKTIPEAAAELNMTSNRLQWYWRQLKGRGLLPSHPRRPTTEAALSNDHHHFDGRPSLYFEDPLLDRLHQEHPDKAPKDKRRS